MDEYYSEWAHPITGIRPLLLDGLCPVGRYGGVIQVKRVEILSVVFQLGGDTLGGCLWWGVC